MPTAPFRINEIFTPNARANVAGLVAVIDQGFGPLTATKTGFVRQSGQAVTDREVLDRLLFVSFEATESVRNTFLNLLFGNIH